MFFDGSPLRQDIQKFVDETL